MTEKKRVAKTLKNVLDTPEMMGIMDRAFDLDVLIPDVQNYWGFDMYRRKPGPALQDGVFVGTDLDLACFMYELSKRGAVINIPKYKSMRPKTIKEGQRVVSSENRHGPIVNLTSNKDVFSFGVRIKDANVMTTDSVGDYRTFSLTDPSGEWYRGWESIQWDPSANENKFLLENDIWTGNRVIFQNFVHPNRWTSFYGQYYFITKALINRMTEEAKYYGQQIKAMLDAGVTYPSEGEKGAPTVWPKQTKDEGKSVKFNSLEVEVDIPDNETKFREFDPTQSNLIYLTQRRRLWNNTIIPSLRFPVRATELAYFKHGIKVDGGEKMPAWISGGSQWERGYKLKGKRIEWDRLVLMQPGVGERAVSIRKRVKQKSEIMSKEYQGGV